FLKKCKLVLVLIQEPFTTIHTVSGTPEQLRKAVLEIEKGMSLAEQDKDTPLDPNVKESKTIYTDGSASVKTEYGCEELIDPPSAGTKYTIVHCGEVDEVEICSTNDQNEAETYCQDMIYHIHGPGPCGYKITN